MPSLRYAHISEALAATPLFEAKSWRLSPQAWPLSREQVRELERVGAACLQFHAALETLYQRAEAGKNLLRNKPLQAPWAAEYLNRGKPASLLAHARHERNRGRLPIVLRPDLLATEDGFALTELDSVPGGIGLTAFLNRLYEPAGRVLGEGDLMIELFYQSLARLAPARSSPVIALVVSDEAATYRPEMEWLAAQLQRRGRRVYCAHPSALFPLGSTVCLDLEGNPERVDVVYRFFELFDLPNVPCAPFLLEAWAAGEVEIAPPMRPFQEEKLSLALLHHHLLDDYWREALPRDSLTLLRRLAPRSWVVDPQPLPPGAVLDGPSVGGRPIADWRQLGRASQKERELILKISGFHETAWGARGVTLGSDVPREQWQQALDQAIARAGANPSVLQEYRKPMRLKHPIYDSHGHAQEREGRVRLCPYFFVADGQARLAGCLATFCPPDKKIIHGMQDAALLPCRVAA